MVDAISIESTLNASADRVWAAFVDPAKRTEWWPGLTFDAVRGGSLQERWAENDVEHVANGTIRDVVPTALLRFTWSDTSWEASTTVLVTLQQHQATTLVRVSESGLAQLSEGPEVAREHEAGWRWHLDQLREHVESQ